MSRTPRSYFESMYGDREDPWDLASSWYEARKYAVTVASLPEARYVSAFEPGCSVGALTGLLAARCSSVLAFDQMPEAVAIARRRLEGLDNVEVRQGQVPEDWPAGPFDLLVLSELCYYFDADELRRLMAVAAGSLSPGATVVAVHWRGATNYPLPGDEAHRIVGDTPGLVQHAQYEEDAFRLGMWVFSPNRAA